MGACLTSNAREGGGGCKSGAGWVSLAHKHFLQPTINILTRWLCRLNSVKPSFAWLNIFPFICPQLLLLKRLSRTEDLRQVESDRFSRFSILNGRMKQVGFRLKLKQSFVLSTNYDVVNLFSLSRLGVANKERRWLQVRSLFRTGMSCYSGCSDRSCCCPVTVYCWFFFLIPFSSMVHGSPPGALEGGLDCVFL